jgi:hypothetical protein
MNSRLSDCHRSFLALPRWVQVWVGAVLVPVNALPFFFLDTPTGRAAAAAAVFVVITNLPIMLITRGMSRLMAVPHLIAWLPLLPYLAARLAFGQALLLPEFLLALTLLVVNAFPWLSTRSIRGAGFADDATFPVVHPERSVHEHLVGHVAVGRRPGLRRAFIHRLSYRGFAS